MPDAVSRLNVALDGRYRIERELGRGGMATVYLARDLRHSRRVALKVLRPELAAVVGGERFLAEIETTANLQHPHILPLFDSGEADSYLFYVMPYVEGESLRDRLDREHQLPVDEAVRIATTLAEALDYAHRHGVIHRDIKPANVLLPDGKPVVSDFGIALAVGVAGGGRLTETGLSLGTPHYMSPEQATGDMNVGAATDIYAIGCVLYEMLVGEPPYTGSTAQAVLGKIIAGEVASARKHRASVSVHVDAAIRRALEKLPADRFAAAQDLARALADVGFRHGETGTELLQAPARWRRLALGGWGAAGVAASALGFALLRPGPAAPVQRFALPFEFGVDPVLLPDGSGVVTGRPTEEGRAQLVLRTWADLEPRPIAGTDGILTGSAMAPGGSEVAFVADGELKVASLQGGGVRVLADSAACCVRWGEDGYVYYSRTRSRAIARVRASGGPIERVTEPESNRVHADYQVLPDRDLAVFAVIAGTGSDAWIDAVRLSTGERKTITAGARPFATPTGHLVFVSQSGDVMAAPFDGEALELDAPPVTLVNRVSTGPQGSSFSVSESGTLVYVVGGVGEPHELVWVNRSGEATPVDPSWRFEPGGSAGWSLSPGGDRIAIREQGQGSAIWIKDLASGVRSRLTFEEGLHRRPRWAPDGQAVTYLAGTNADLNVWSKRADGTGDTQLLLDFALGIAEGFWSPDGVWLMVRPGGGADLGVRDILGIRLGADTAMTTFVATRESAEESPALSPDMRWLAYSSDETGRLEVYVRPFPDVDSYRVVVSRAGGMNPVWSRDGRELFFVSGETRELMAAEVRTTLRFEVGRVETLFAIPSAFVVDRTSDFYDVSPQGDRFLMARRINSETAEPQLILVQNWFEELRERVPN